MTDDKALELYEQCDRDLPDRGDLGSFKRLIGAFARTLLAAPPAAALAPGAIPEWREPAANEHPIAKRWREDAANKYGDLVGVIQAIREYINVERDWNRPYNSEMSDRVTNADVETAEQLMLSRIRAEAAWFSSNAAPTPSTPAPIGWFDKQMNNVRWKAGLVNADFEDGQPFYTIAIESTSTPAPQSSGNRATYVPPRDPEFSFSEGVAKGYADGWNACLDASTPAPVAIDKGVLHRLNDATKAVSAADRNLLLRYFGAPPTRPDVGEARDAARYMHGALSKLEAAQMCKPQAVQFLIEEAINTLQAGLAPQSSEKEDQVIAAKQGDAS